MEDQTQEGSGGAQAGSPEMAGAESESKRSPWKVIVPIVLVVIVVALIVWLAV